MTDVELAAAAKLFAEPTKCRECLGLNGALCRSCGGTGMSPKNRAGLALLAENKRLRERVTTLEKRLQDVLDTDRSVTVAADTQLSLATRCHTSVKPERGITYWHDDQGDGDYDEGSEP